MADTTPMQKVVQLLRDSNESLDNEQASDLAEKVFTFARMEAAGAFPYKEGDSIVLGPEVFVTQDGSVLNWRGQNYVPQIETEATDPELKDYKLGEKIQVIKNGDWMNGFIQSRDPGNGPLHVFTERGPVTVASTSMIRRIPTDG